MEAGWRSRLYRVSAGLGHGPEAASLELVLEAPEWIGPFGSLAEDTARQALIRSQIVETLARRFPGESITLVSLIPIAKRQRLAWDRRA
jgi:hypothetical protein